MATRHDDHSYLARLASGVRQRVQQSEQKIEVTLETGERLEDGAEPPPPPPPPPKEKEKDAKKEETAPVDPEKKQEPPPPEKKELVPVVKEKDPAKQLDPPDPMKDKRIAVKQHAKPDQKDNPNAKFIGDEANHVEDESAATQTAHDQDDKNPTPGGSHAGPQGKVGDSDRTKIADSEDRKGEKNRSPGDRGTEFEVQKLPPAERPQGPQPIAGAKSLEPPKSGGDGRPKESQASADQTPQVAPGAPQDSVPEVTQSGAGNWTFNPMKPGTGQGSAQETGPGSAQKAPNTGNSQRWLGLGGQPGPGQVNINLSHQGIVAVVGVDQLRKEREADGERRKSEHRGSWQASNFERWRSAIENYVSSVKPGNQTALNTARVPFATYMHGVHLRIHPIFADNFLDSIESLPRTHPLSDTKLVTKLEIIVSREGRLVKMGVVKASGVTAFDIAALDAVQRASPFGPAPQAIISPDGNVYLHWEFYRNREYACSTMNAFPYIVNSPPGAVPKDPLPPMPGPKGPPPERGPAVNPNESRHGALPVPQSGNVLARR